MKALSKAELEKLALAQGDVKGFTVEKASADDVGGLPAGAKVEPAECVPYVDLATATAPGEPDAVALRTVTEEQAEPKVDADGDLGMKELENFEKAMKDAMGAAAVRVGVATYEGGGAVTALEDLRGMVEGCKGPFGVSGDGNPKSRLTDVKVSDSAHGVDETVTFSVAVDLGGQPTVTVKWGVYRDGNSVATFSATSASALMGESDDSFDVPKPVVEAQLAKLD